LKLRIITKKYLDQICLARKREETKNVSLALNIDTNVT